MRIGLWRWVFICLLEGVHRTGTGCLQKLEAGLETGAAVHVCSSSLSHHNFIVTLLQVVVVNRQTCCFSFSLHLRLRFALHLRFALLSCFTGALPVLAQSCTSTYFSKHRYSIGLP